MRRKKLGREGERLAEEFLRKRGYKILARNYRYPFGEIDLIARDGKTIAFIEIKGRSSQYFGSALEAVTTRKQKRIARVAAQYLATFKLDNIRARFDVVGIHWATEGKPEVVLIKDAFRLSD